MQTSDKSGHARTESLTMVRNVISTLITQFISWGLTMAVALYLPKYAGENGLGKMAFAGSFVSLFAVLVPLGTDIILVREIARNKERTAEFLLATTLIRLPLAVLMTFITYSLSLLLKYDQEIQRLVLTIGLSSLVGTLAGVIGKALQGQERIVRSNVANLIQRFAESSIIIGLILLKAPLWMIAAASGVAALIGVGPNLHALQGLPEQFLRITGEPQFQKRITETMRFLAFGGLPFMGWSIANQLYGCTDPLVLKTIGGLPDIAWYNVATRLSGTSLFIPIAVSGALSPLLMRLYREDEQKFEQLARRMFAINVLIGIPTSIILSFDGEYALTLLHYSAGFAKAADVLHIAGGFCFTMFLGMALGTILTASDRQRVLLRSAIVGAIIAIPLCIMGSFMTRQWMGNAAIGAMASDAVLELFIIAIYIKGLPFPLFDRPTVHWLSRCFLATIPMVGMLVIGRYCGIGLWATIPALVLYSGVCILLKCVDSDWLMLMREIALRRYRTS